ncbi:hypothetical protein [Mycolicibacterium boenickei]|uniref:hypothetical protein n=1 Tax=Mycolicibacterium boenickei TaxID=146017 RepID=UPI00194EB0AA|nr:hypothetical protein [Mycolicibacterium boenickei]
MSVPGPGGGFELDGWNFKPAAVPWYRTRPAVVAMVAAAVAAAAIVVSGVLLLLRDSPSAPEQATTPSPAPSATGSPGTTARPAAGDPGVAGVPPHPPALRNQEARDRRHPHPGHPLTDQRGPAAATSPQLRHPRN